MFYDFLAFFGPPLLGGMLSHSLAGMKRGCWLAVATVAAVIGFENLAFCLPFRGAATEALCVAAGTVTIMLVFLFVPVEGSDSRRGFASMRYAHPSSVLLVFLLPVASFTLVGRVNKAQQMAISFDGIVTDVYHSHNHAAPSAVITEADGSTVTIENIDRATWEHLVPRRSHLKKAAWTADGELDGRQVHIVPR